MVPGAGGKKSCGDLPQRIEATLTRLARECLAEEPHDVDRFCYEQLAAYLASRISSKLPSQALQGLASEVDEESDFRQAKLAPRDNQPGPSSRAPQYNSTDESSDGDDVAVQIATRVKSMKFEDDAVVQEDIDIPGNSMFSMHGLSQQKLDCEVARYKGDERMQSLYDAWDADKSGAIDLVELVVELHKFDEVARDGKGIQAASEALVQCVNSDNGEIELDEFAKVIVLFCHNIFKKEFDEVAEHMLAVATSTSEEAARHAAEGRDTSEIEQADKEEEEFLRATVKGIEDHVNDNIRRIRTTRVKVKKKE